MKLGYARVSTDDQRLDLQRARLTRLGVAVYLRRRSPAPPGSGPRWSGCSRSCAPMTSWSSPGSTAWHAQPRSCCALPRLSLRKMRDCSRLKNPGRIRPRQLDAWS